MSTIVLYPFYSQQDKKTGEFLPTCGNVKQMQFLAKKLQCAGHRVRMLCPPRTQHWFDCEIRTIDVPNENPLQRLYWNSYQLREACKDADLAICNHEFAAIPLRRLFSKLKIVQMCSVQPDDPALFTAAWNSADLVVAQGFCARNFIQDCTETKIEAWRMAFDEEQYPPLHDRSRDIDCLFLLRCSATNYTHHMEFLRALPMLKDLRIVFTDPTSFLKQSCPHLEYSTHGTYKSVLYNSKCFFAANDNLYGGMSCREAMAAGCVPVVLDAPCYRELVGARWNNFVRRLEPQAIADAVRIAVHGDCDRKALRRRALQESYQAAWPEVERCVASLLS